MKMINQVPCLQWLLARPVLSNNKTVIGALALLLGTGLSSFGADNRAPEVPAQLVVPIGNKVHFHGFGVGFQVYTWNGASWGSAVPDAVLFDGQGVVATHFAGPTWQSNSGSTVVGALPPVGVIVDTNSIPWLRLNAVPEKTFGPGIFDGTTFIQRVNTTGGKAPSAPGTVVGQVARVPYTADYFFFRSTDTDNN